MALLLFLLLLGLFLVGVPIAFSLGLASAITVWHGDLMPMLIVTQQLIGSVNSFPLMAIPFFILAGFLMQHGGISERLVNFSNTLVGGMTGVGNGRHCHVVVLCGYFWLRSGNHCGDWLYINSCDDCKRLSRKLRSLQPSRLWCIGRHYPTQHSANSVRYCRECVGRRYVYCGHTARHPGCHFIVSFCLCVCA